MTFTKFEPPVVVRPSQSISRRALLRAAATGALGVTAPLLLGCQKGSSGGRTIADPSSKSDAPLVRVPAREAGICALTHDNIEGPYYRPGAPRRDDLTDPAFPGVVLDLEGRVTAGDCKTPLGAIELDFWQANADGHYDNDGTLRLGGKLLLRGRVLTDGDGRYRLRTIVPGRYLNGAQYRPAHIHVKLRGVRVPELTTQLYFPDDPYNRIDPFIHESLVMEVAKKASGLRAHFDFSLRTA